MRPHVAVDGRLWGSYWTGTASYLRGVTRALGNDPGGLRYTLLLSDNVDAEPFMANPGWHVVRTGATHLMDDVWEQVALPTEVAAAGAQVLFAPSGTVPLARDFAAVPVIHDLGFLHHPEFYRDRLRRYLSKWVRLACLTSASVVCNSEFTRGSVMEEYGVKAHQCRTVYPAAGPLFQAAAATGERQRIMDRYGAEPPYVMTVSSGGPNKNLPRLLEAMGLIWEEMGFGGLRLVIVGPERASGTVVNFAPDLVEENKVVLAERVPAEDLAALYRTAGLFVFPSLYEGFGLPPVEAMTCGTPVVASDRASLPEVLGDAALLCDPEDTAALADAMATVLSDEKVGTRLRRVGLEWVRRYSWKRSARLLADLFVEVVART